ncbi:hypothetical protein F4680DRAFT_399877 [Xylaria scruposa]|nr:hypothetical protein F4680DRAFT_399877 [Xylaria scruposa]
MFGLLLAYLSGRAQGSRAPLIDPVVDLLLLCPNLYQSLPPPFPPLNRCRYLAHKVLSLSLCTDATIFGPQSLACNPHLAP